ncbi:MAG: hypothetical protein LN569_04625 [Rickettsia endosymbiont of Labidopullus appendiculatus]|nr:hypothetical protein [Rickettsia endosymbiont of Labidopullus appendiculatus]
MSKNNDTVTITNHGEIGTKRLNGLLGKYHPVVNHDGSLTEKPTGDLFFQDINNANIDNASSTIALSDNTPIILSVRGNITETEITKINDAVVCKTISITNENNDSSLLLGENAVAIEDTPTE